MDKFFYLSIIYYKKMERLFILNIVLIILLIIILIFNYENIKSKSIFGIILSISIMTLFINGFLLFNYNKNIKGSADFLKNPKEYLCNKAAEKIKKNKTLFNLLNQVDNMDQLIAKAENLNIKDKQFQEVLSLLKKSKNIININTLKQCLHI